jgi:probable rRNA maturation factor
MISVEYPFPEPIETAPLEQAVRLVLQTQAAPAGAELTIVLADDEKLQDLNLDFRGIDSPTDVLSFPANEPDPDTGTVYIGDVIVSVDRAQEQALAGGHSLQAELQLLIVHGVLHLLGHDHADPDQKNSMWAAQSIILSKLGIAGIKISE